MHTTMKKLLILVWVILFVGCNNESNKIKDYPIQPVPFTSVKLTEGFWYNRSEINRKVTIPYNFEKCEETGRISNFAKAGGLEEGEFEGIYFNDSDVFKVIEGASYSLQIYPDPELDKYLDGLIAKIAAAQEEDGYLYTNRTINPKKAADKAGEERWTSLNHYHELYNVGHMYEAAAAHYQATGKTSLLDVAIKNADLIDDVFGPGKNMGVPGHEEIEIGLVKLYRVTGDSKYLELAKFFIDQRGNAEGHQLYGEYAQDHKLVTEQDEAVGHSVRAGYLYSGMADVAALTGDEEYIKALDEIWNNVVTKKLYLTGGIGASRHGEAFSENYDLPNATAYTETCAAIANMLWNHRMFLLEGDSKYMDIFERTLYNGFLAGISLDGKNFFYPNPLEFNGEYPFNQGAVCRSPWFNCSCCPVNIVRTIPSIPGYIYAVSDKNIYVNLFINSETDIQLKNKKLRITQETEYPWDGNVKISISPEKNVNASLKIRIPGWADNKPVPGDLYKYLVHRNERIRIYINDEEIEFQVENGYAVIDKTWHDGDFIEFNIPMPVRKVISNHNVEDNRGKVALEKGPIVYAAESIDNDGEVLKLLLEKYDIFSSEFHPEILQGINLLSGQAYMNSGESQNEVNWIKQDFLAVPYYAWAHRGVGEMAVWLACEREVLQTIDHLACQKEVKVETKPSPKYGSSNLLTDCLKGELDNFFQWTGFEGEDMIGIIDLGNNQAVKTVSVGCLQNTDYWIFLPEEIEVSSSTDGKDFSKTYKGRNSNPAENNSIFRNDFNIQLDGTSTRYLKITAKNIKRCPSWHSAAGGMAWIFIDEIIVE